MSRLLERSIFLRTTLSKVSKLIPVIPLFCSNSCLPTNEDPPNIAPSITLMALLDKSLKREASYRNDPKFSDKQVNSVDPDQTAPVGKQCRHRSDCSCRTNR